MNDGGPASRFSRKFQARRLVLKLLIWGFSGSRNLVLSIKTREMRTEMRTEVLHVDFAINVNFSPCVWLGVFKYLELSSDYSNLLRTRIEVYTSIYAPKISTSALAPEIAYFGGSRIRNSVLNMKTHLNYVLRVYQSIFEKVAIFSPWSRDCKFWGPSISGTQLRNLLVNWCDCPLWSLVYIIQGHESQRSPKMPL